LAPDEAQAFHGFTEPALCRRRRDHRALRHLDAGLEHRFGLDRLLVGAAAVRGAGSAPSTSATIVSDNGSGFTASIEHAASTRKPTTA
jgi:hypothetical protein